jgi:hypothetical protein
MKRCLALFVVVLAVGCDKKEDAGGLPPASKWHSGSGSAGSTPDPHAGMNMGGGAGAGGTADPHAGMDMGGGAGGTADPHAGMDMSGGAGGADPHAGMDMSGGAHGGGGGGGAARAPNPDRYLRGTITVGAKFKDAIKPGGALYVTAKRPDPKTGEGVGMPLVVQKLTIDAAGVPFDLTEADAMAGSVELTGDLVVTARYDQDGDAFSKQEGDVSGSVRVTVPAKDLKIVLDQPYVAKPNPAAP